MEMGNIALDTVGQTRARGFSEGILIQKISLFPSSLDQGNIWRKCLRDDSKRARAVERLWELPRRDTMGLVSGL